MATAALHVATASRYGYFRDELYYLACAEHLDLGYVDHPPLVAVVAALTRTLLGDALIALRLVPAMTGAATVLAAALLAGELGGGRFARRLAAVATVCAPVYLVLFGFLSMNAFDVLIWALLWWLAARMLRTGDPRLWLPFGLVAGVGLENKLSVLFVGFGVVAGMIAARRPDLLWGRWIWLGGTAAALLFLPHAVWQAAHGWPTVEFVANAAALKNIALSPLQFVGEQVLQAGPGALPVWTAAIAFLLFGRSCRPWRALGWAYLAIFLLMAFTNAKPYYIAPAYTLLFAAGAVALEGLPGAGLGPFARALAPALVVASGIVTAPLVKPLLPVETAVAYVDRLGVKPSTGERQAAGRLPQFFADMHGWPELAQAVADVYRSLPPDEQARACVFASNYGQAAAIDFFGPALGLPKSISPHNSYFLWGPGSCTGEVVVVIGAAREELLRLFEAVEEAARFRCENCTPYEGDKPMWVARRLRRPAGEVWPALKRYI